MRPINSQAPYFKGWLHYSPLFLITLIDAIGTSIFIPILTAVLLSENPNILTGYTLSVRQLFYGFNISVFAWLVLYLSPIMGDFSDKKGRKKILLISTLLITASYLIIGLSIQLASAMGLVLGRVLGGVGASNLAVSQAAVLDNTEMKRKVFLISMCLFTSSFGFILGPFIAGVFSPGKLLSLFGYSTSLYFVMFLSVVAFALLYFFYNDRSRLETNQNKRISSLDLLKGWHNFISAFTHPDIRRISIGFFLMQLGWNAFFIFYPNILQKDLSMSFTQISMFVFLLGIGYITSYAIISPRLFKCFSPDSLIVKSLIATSLLLFVAFINQSHLLVWFFSFPLAICISIAYGSFINLFILSTEESRHGWVLGISISVVLFSIAIISLFSGIVSLFSAKMPIFMSITLVSASAFYIHMALLKNKS